MIFRPKFRKRKERIDQMQQKNLHFFRFMNKNLKLGSLCIYHLDFATKCVARAATLYHDMYTVLVLYNIHKKILYCTKKNKLKDPKHPLAAHSYAAARGC